MSFPATQFLGGFRRLDWLILLLGGSGIQRSWLGDKGSRSRGWGLGGCGTCTFLESVWVRLAHGDNHRFFLCLRGIGDEWMFLGDYAVTALLCYLVLFVWFCSVWGSCSYFAVKGAPFLGKDVFAFT